MNPILPLGLVGLGVAVYALSRKPAAKPLVEAEIPTPIESAEVTKLDELFDAYEADTGRRIVAMCRAVEGHCYPVRPEDIRGQPTAAEIPNMPGVTWGSAHLFVSLADGRGYLPMYYTDDRSVIADAVDDTSEWIKFKQWLAAKGLTMPNLRPHHTEGRLAIGRRPASLAWRK